MSEKHNISEELHLSPFDGTSLESGSGGSEIIFASQASSSPALQRRLDELHLSRFDGTSLESGSGGSEIIFGSQASSSPALQRRLDELDLSPFDGTSLESGSGGSEIIFASQASSSPALQRRLDVSISITHENMNSNGFKGSIIMPVEHNDNLQTCGDINDSSLVTQEIRSPKYVLSLRLFGFRPPVKRLANDWTNTYNLAPSEALRSILELILHTTGVKCTLDKKKAEKLKYLSIGTFESWMEEPNIYPLVPNEEYLRSLAKFLQLTLKEVVLLNRNFMIQLHILLSVMVNSKWRSARFTAALFGTEISQLYSQFLMGSPNVTQTLKEPKLEEVKNTFKEFLSLVLLCLRDVDLFIRRFTLNVFSKWYKDYPKILLNDIYLRNIYWAVFDPCTIIRLMAIKTCYTLITTVEYTSHLGLFIKKILPGLLKRTHDKSEIVAVKAVNSITAIYSKFPGLIGDESTEEIYKLIYCNQPTLSSASALFLYEVLRKYHRDSIHFILEITSFLYESEIQFSCKCNHVLLESIFQHASHQLMDWSAWTSLLLGDNFKEQKHLHKLACRFLISTIHYAITCTFENFQSKKYYPPLPNTQELDRKRTPTSIKNKDDYGMFKKNQEAITNHFGQYIVQLLGKYNHDPECLIHLVSIPKYFSKINVNMDIQTLCAYLIAVKFHSTRLLEESISTLAFLHDLMLQSYRFKKYTSTLKQILCNKHMNEFLNSCKRIADCPKYCQHIINVNMIVLKKVFFITQYFDMSETKMLNNGLEALRYSTAKLNPKIIAIVAPVCLYIVQWQLKNVIERKFSEDELKTRLYKIQSQVRTIAIHLEYLICHKSSSIRQPAFSVLCRLLTLCSPKNKYTKPYFLIHLPRPSIIVSEWLNFNLLLDVPWDESPSDHLELCICSGVLSKFCTLLSGGILHITYISSILPYFCLYKKERNYNTVLKEVFRRLINRPFFSTHLIEALIFLTKSRKYNMKVLTNGLCSAALSKLKPVQLGQAVSNSIITCGLSYIQDHKDLTIFSLLVPFVSLLSRYDAMQMKLHVLDVFYLYNNEDFVKNFLDAFG